MRVQIELAPEDLRDFAPIQGEANLLDVRNVTKEENEFGSILQSFEPGE